MSNSRIPESAAKFNGYITSTDDENTTTNPATGNPWWQDLGITSQNKDDWHTKRQDWVLLYAKYQNANTKTSVVIEAVENFIRDFKTFAQPLLDIMAASTKATEESEHIYRFVLKKNRKPPTRRKTAITEKCYSKVNSIGGAEFIFACSAHSDSKLASLPEGVDGVMVYTKIYDQPPGGLNSIVVDDTWKKDPYSTARFVHDAAEASIGKWMLYAVRWTYSPNAKFNGPLSAVQMALIA